MAKFMQDQIIRTLHNVVNNMNILPLIISDNTGLLYSAFSIISSKHFAQYYPSKDS